MHRAVDVISNANAENFENAIMIEDFARNLADFMGELQAYKNQIRILVEGSAGVPDALGSHDRDFVGAQYFDGDNGAQESDVAPAFDSPSVLRPQAS
jgi:hypothetical protein